MADELAVHPNPLEEASTELLALITQLRQLTVPPDIASLQTYAVGAVKRFEREALRLGVPDDAVKEARYVLCTSVDEMVLNTPWGSTSDWDITGLSAQFHRKNDGGDYFFELHDRLLRDPVHNLDLLELMYLCLCLGFQGRYRILDGGRDKLDAMREHLYALLRQYRPRGEGGLSPHWAGEDNPNRALPRRFPVGWAAAVVVAMLLVTFMTYYIILGQQTTPVFALLASLTVPAPEMGEDCPAPRETMPVGDIFSDEVQSGRIEVNEDRDEGYATIVLQDGMFNSGADVPNDPAFIQTIASKIKRYQDERQVQDILVIGHTDSRGRDAYNLDLSKRRALNVARSLLQALDIPSNLVKYQGLGETRPRASNDTAGGRARNRRVEVRLWGNRASLQQRIEQPCTP